MKTELKKIENSKVEINVEIEAVEFEKSVQAVIGKIKKRITIQGFRKGKAPESVVVQNVGEMNVLSDAAEELINKSYSQIIKENKLEPLGRPEINIIKIARKNPLVFKIVVAFFPEIKLADYSGPNLPKIELKKDVGVVDEKEVEQTLDYVRKSRAKLFDKEGSDLAEKGDFVYIEYTNIADNQKNEDRFILGQSEAQPNPFEKEVIGMKIDETKIVKIKTDKNKETEFNLVLKSIKRVELPEINDEFIKTIGKFNNLEDFKANIREGIKAEKISAEKQRVCFEFLEKLRTKTKIDIPEILIKLEQEKMLAHLKENVEKEIPFGEYLEKIGKSEEEMLKSFEDQAKVKVANFLILREISKEQKIEATKEELDKKTKEIVQYYELKEEDIDKPQIEKYAEEQIIAQKTFNYIYSLYNNN